MMWQQRWRGMGRIGRVAFAVVSLAVAAAACSSSTSYERVTVATTAPRATTTVVTTTAGAPAPEDAASTTTTAPPAEFTTPSEAGRILFTAWTTGSRDGAALLGLAPPAELEKLFAAVPGPDAENRGCDEGAFGAASCFFGNGQGGVDVELAPSATGWSIVSIDPFG